MTTLLEKAFSKATQLPAEDQDRLAKRVLAAIESEQRWTELFEQSQDELATLARETLAEHRAGKTQRLDPNDL